MKNNSFNQTASFRLVGRGKGGGGRGGGRSQPRVSRKRRARACAISLHNACIARQLILVENWPAFYLKKQKVCELDQIWSSCRADVCAASPHPYLFLVVSVVQSTLPAVTSQAIIRDVYAFGFLRRHAKPLLTAASSKRSNNGVCAYIFS